MLSFLGQCAVCGQLCRHTGRAGRDRLQGEATLCIKDDGGLLSFLSWIYTVFFGVHRPKAVTSLFSYIVRYFVSDSGNRKYTWKGGEGLLPVLEVTVEMKKIRFISSVCFVFHMFFVCFKTIKCT